MRRLLPIAFVLLAAAPAAAQPVPSPGALAAQENAVWQAVADHRYDAFAAFLARDYVGVYAEGFRDAAQEVAAIRGVTIARFQISDFVVRSVDSNDVVVTYRIDVSGSAGGQDYAGRFNISSYWHHAGRQWHVALHTESQIAR
jgi:hypothetical protein